MRRYSKAPPEMVVEASQITKKQCSYDVQPKEEKQKTQPGAALIASLEHYRNTLLERPCDRRISALVDSCDFILDEVGQGAYGC